MKDKIKFALGTAGIDLDLGLKLEEFVLFDLCFSVCTTQQLQG